MNLNNNPKNQADVYEAPKLIALGTLADAQTANGGNVKDGLVNNKRKFSF